LSTAIRVLRARTFDDYTDVDWLYADQPAALPGRDTPPDESQQLLRQPR
jgi:hypothetical protein